MPTTQLSLTCFGLWYDSVMRTLLFEGHFNFSYWFHDFLCTGSCVCVRENAQESHWAGRGSQQFFLSSECLTTRLQNPAFLLLFLFIPWILQCQSSRHSPEKCDMRGWAHLNLGWRVHKKHIHSRHKIMAQKLVASPPCLLVLQERDLVESLQQTDWNTYMLKSFFCSETRSYLNA